MIRSLFGGVSGLTNHQTMMDVIGNNIANVNTIGFKSGRVTFKESLTSTLQAALRPTDQRGGVNPMQIGLGMAVGSIDSDFSQGNLESTGQSTDLAIQGDGFFVLSNSQQEYYTRAGNFTLDADGRLVSPNNGYVLQGKMADNLGVITDATPITDLVIPFGSRIPANATTEVQLGGNLDAAGEPLGSIIRSEALYAIDDGSYDIQGLLRRDTGSGDSAMISGMAPNSTTVTVTDGIGNTEDYTYVDSTTPGTNQFNTLAQLVAEINSDFATFGATFDATTGEIVFNDIGGATGFEITSTNAELERALSFANGDLTAGNTVTQEFSHVAEGTDLLENLRNNRGVSLNLNAGDQIDIDGDVGGTAITTASLTVTGGASTYQNLVDTVESSFGILNDSGVAINDTGAMVITGDGGMINELANINIENVTNVAPTDEFDAVFTTGNYAEVQEAEDYTQNASITSYDSTGAPHVLTFSFTKNPESPNSWTWSANVGTDTATVITGGTGTLGFDADGRLDTFAYDNGADALTIDPGNGAEMMEIDVDAGTAGTINGLSQFSGSSSTIVESQDGYTSGVLTDMSIGSDGEVTGYFNNGVAQSLAQIVLATFNNPAGLMRGDNNMYEESPNSGQAVVGTIGSTVQSKIASGNLEQSNVELAQEFSKMVVAQKGFQANARVITVSDQMLTEVVRLKS